ncbi:hypothetical protein GALMADRAFT_148194 [Galerina marginata CBS 339.88]|uniref:Uncharacterized protein n=1 Tax=Galerina marginata (strain CBS 339.88) TaxID=685588 RepID=A0A067SE78_GALM3|nr:hypothetical protein GALMADRAFT_148194 [Galerina marginata CBS 339.88]
MDVRNFMELYASRGAIIFFQLTGFVAVLTSYKTRLGNRREVRYGPCRCLDGFSTAEDGPVDAVLSEKSKLVSSPSSNPNFNELHDVSHQMSEAVQVSFNAPATVQLPFAVPPARPRHITPGAAVAHLQSSFKRAALGLEISCCQLFLVGASPLVSFVHV